MYQHFALSSISVDTLFAIADFFADWPGTCFLYSGGDLLPSSQSFLSLFPFETVSVKGLTLHHQYGHQCQICSVSNPWEGLQDYFFAKLAQDPLSMAFGWFSYEMGSYADFDQTLPYHHSSTLDAYWQRCAIVLSYHHQKKEMTIQIDSFAISQLEEKAQKWVNRFITEEGWQIFIQQLPQFEISLKSFFHHSQSCLNDFNRESDYLNKVYQAQELIRTGEIYQVNLAQVFNFQNTQRPFHLFQKISQLNPAPFSAYFCHPQLHLVCTSPERFLCKQERKLETRPIKGTIRRGKNPDEDKMLKEHLLTSPKERAELLMITDLMRNDLGKISEIGSVVVEDLWHCEAYTNVFHLLSIIHSQVKKEWTPLEIVRACFPGGSITGCPKLRAMEVIYELEESARGIYTGSIGYFTGKGNFDLNIAIRTLAIEKNKSSLHLGSGIVIDSNPEQEYQETLIKGQSLFNILEA